MRKPEALHPFWISEVFVEEFVDEERVFREGPTLISSFRHY
jgi:hypothetical protein